jgi:CxxC motif-containing protein (DUF1111 family)/predicted lipoprotein with Yx(FWY)xxD motif
MSGSNVADSDNDGVSDDNDAFPNDPNETLDTDGDGVGNNADAFPNDPTETLDENNNGIGDNADANNANNNSGPQSSYCEAPIYHLNMEAEASTLINLTIENIGNDRLRVAITSGDSSPVDFLSVELAGATISDDTSVAPGELANILAWSGSPPDSVSLTILWSKASVGGNWIVRDISVPTDAICADSTYGDNSNTGGTGDGTNPNPNPNPAVSKIYKPSFSTLDEVSVHYVSSSIGDEPRLVGGMSSSNPGYALYTFDSDTVNGSTSSCNGGCADSWPPLLSIDGMPTGIQGLGTITRNNGTKQVTYQGKPLYFYAFDDSPGVFSGDLSLGWHSVIYQEIGSVRMLYDASTEFEPVTSFVADDGVVITRIADRGRDRHAKDSSVQDHYDHYLSHYWQYRTMRIQLEDYVPLGQSLIKVTWITESALGAKEFRVWYAGQPTTGQFWFNPQPAGQQANPNEPGVHYHGSGTWDDNFEKTSDVGGQHKYTLDIINRWDLGGQIQETLQTGWNMEFEASMFLSNPPAGSRLNYYGTSFVYKIGQGGVHPFKWVPGQKDGTPILAKGKSGGGTTLGYNYTNEPAGRFMQMATNMAPDNADLFVKGRRVHHTSFVNGEHGERCSNLSCGEIKNPPWTDQVDKSGPHYINESCASCHVRNGRALVADVGGSLDKWVFRVGDANGNPMSSIGSVLQPVNVGVGNSEGSVTLGAWSIMGENDFDGDFIGLRKPNYEFSNVSPAKFSARIAPSLIGMGLLEAIDEVTIMAWADEHDHNNDLISGRASMVIDPEAEDPETDKKRLGRFGYKAATFSVKHQVASALNTDMGVMTSMIKKPDCGILQTNCGNSGSEIADEHLDNLVKYVSLLGVGARRDYTNETGEDLFHEIGCADCHRPSFVTSNNHPLAELRGQTIYPYTDLLLHNMGPGLADSLGEGTATGLEWRTAPLWGLGLAKDVMLGDLKGNDLISIADAQNRSANQNRIGYLHDGRAGTIDEAIRWHGGEAKKSRQLYSGEKVDDQNGLTDSERNSLLMFLESL